MRLVRLGEAADPGRGRADHAGPDAGRLERGDRKERGRGLAVGAGDPDHAQLVARVAVPPGRRAGQGGRGALDDELGQGDVRVGVLHEGRGRAALRGTRHEVVAVHVLAPDRHEEPTGLDLAGVEGNAPDRHVGEGGRTDRPPVAAGASQRSVAGQPLDQAAEGPGLPGSAARSRSAIVGSVIGAATPRLARPAGREVATRIEDALVRPAELEPLATERQLVLVQAVERAALAGFPARAGDVHASEVHLGAALADGQLDRTPAEEVEGPGCSARLAAWSPE